MAVVTVVNGLRVVVSESMSKVFVAGRGLQCCELKRLRVSKLRSGAKNQLEVKSSKENAYDTYPKRRPRTSRNDRVIHDMCNASLLKILNPHPAPQAQRCPYSMLQRARRCRPRVQLFSQRVRPTIVVGLGVDAHGALMGICR